MRSAHLEIHITVCVDLLRVGLRLQRNQILGLKFTFRDGVCWFVRAGKLGHAGLEVVNLAPPGGTVDFPRVVEGLMA